VTFTFLDFHRQPPPPSSNRRFVSIAKRLRTPTIGLQFQTLADQAIREKHTYTRYLEALRFKRLACLD
jgi:hypothetical protein